MAGNWFGDEFLASSVEAEALAVSRGWIVVGAAGEPG